MLRCLLYGKIVSLFGKKNVACQTRIKRNGVHASIKIACTMGNSAFSGFYLYGVTVLCSPFHTTLGLFLENKCPLFAL